MGNYGTEIKNDTVATMVHHIQDAGKEGLATVDLVKISGVNKATVHRWLSEYATEHPELSVPPERSRRGWRWVSDPENRIERTDKPIDTAIIDYLEVRGSEGATAGEIAKAIGYSKVTVRTHLCRLAKEHIELNTPGRGGNNRPYIWTPVVVKEQTSDEIDPNDLEAIQAAFGQKAVEKDAERVSKHLPEFSWKDEVKPEKSKEDAVTDEDMSTKNAEGYNDPTAAAAIRSAEKSLTKKSTSKTAHCASMVGEVWAIDRQFGGEDYFVILTSSDNHVCGVTLRYENSNYPYPQNSYIYTDGGAKWVGDTRRVCTKPKKALCRKVGSISDEGLYALRFSVSSALELLGDASESKVREMESCIEMQEAKIKELESIKEQNDSLVATVDRLMAELETEKQRSAHYCSEAKISDDKNDELVAENADLYAEIDGLKIQLAAAQNNDYETEVRNMHIQHLVDRATINAYELAMRCLGGKGVE